MPEWARPLHRDQLMWRDLRLAARSLRHSKTFALMAVTGLALAIAANATIFSVIDGLWFRPPGIAHPDRLVRVFATTTNSAYGLWSFPEYGDLRKLASTCETVVAVGRRGTIVRTEPAGAGDLALVNVVNEGFFDTLGVAALHGRLFAAADESTASGPVVALGYNAWMRRFGGDRAVVGRTIRLGRRGDVVATIAGVLPQSFRELDAGADRELWMPMSTWQRLNGGDELTRRDDRWLEIAALRLPNITPEAVNAQFAAAAVQFASAFPAVSAGRGARVLSDRAYRLETGGDNAWPLFGLGLLVVIITSVNVANLLLARSAGRKRDLAVRAAIGASRARLVRQSFAESTIIGSCGLAAGLLLAGWTVRVLPSILVPPPGLSASALFVLDARTVLFAAALATFTTALFGAIPAFTAGRSSLQSVIGSARTTSAGGGRAARVLVVLQLAVSISLLSAAGVLSRSFLATRLATHGMAHTAVMTAWAPGGAVPAATLAEAVARLSSLPGAGRVAIALRAPLSLSGGGLAQPIVIPGVTAADVPLTIKFGAVGPTYFDTLGTRLLAGRVFTPADDTGAPVAIVNETFARQFFGGGAIDRVINLGGRAAVPHRVIGVVEDVVVNSIGEPAAPYFYLPFSRVPSGEVTFLIETAAASPDAATVRAALTAVDPALTPRQVVSMAEYRRYAANAFETTAALAASLGLVGLILSALGVYGVIATRAADRTREFGIRLALGAARGRILRMVLAEGGVIAAGGALIGLPIALVTTNALRSLLFGVGPWDAVALAGALGVVGASLLIATLLPAWRATRVSPTVALQES